MHEILVSENPSFCRKSGVKLAVETGIGSLETWSSWSEMVIPKDAREVER